MEALTEEDKRFSDIVKIEFLEKIMRYGEVPSHVNFYRPCKFKEQKGDYFIYLYPESSDKEIPYKLYCPKRFVNEAIRIYKDGRNLINDIVETYKIKG